MESSRRKSDAPHVFPKKPLSHLLRGCVGVRVFVLMHVGLHLATCADGFILCPCVHPVGRLGSGSGTDPAQPRGLR